MFYNFSSLEISDLLSAPGTFHMLSRNFFWRPRQHLNRQNSVQLFCLKILETRLIRIKQLCLSSLFSCNEVSSTIKSYILSPLTTWWPNHTSFYMQISEFIWSRYFEMIFEIAACSSIFSTLNSIFNIISLVSYFIEFRSKQTKYLKVQRMFPL